jgi:hypothetical protein
MNALETARAQLREIVHELEAVKHRLLSVRESLPEPVAGPQAAAEDLGKLDARMEIRSVIECIVHDWMDPAIGDLREAALPSPRPDGEKE